MKGVGESIVAGLSPVATPRDVARAARTRMPAWVRRSRRHREARHRMIRMALRAFRARESRKGVAQ